MNEAGPLFILPNLRGGGAEKVALNVVGGLVARGARARLYLMSDEGIAHGIPAGLQRAGRLIGPADEGKSESIDAGRARGGFAQLFAQARRADVLVGALEIKTYPLAVLLGLLLRKPAVLWLHKDLGPFLARKRGWQRALYRGLLACHVRLAGRVVAVSDGVAASLAAAVPGAARKTVRLPNPIDFTAIDAALAENAAPPDFGERYVLAVGRLTWQKGFDVLLEAFAAIAPRFHGLTLVILGDGELRAGLEARVAALGLAGRVRLPGFVRPYRAMAGAAVLALSSRFEGLPTVLIEALYCGAPVVSTDCPSGPAQILCGGRFGELVPVETPRALAEALAAALLVADTASARAARRARARDFSFDTVMPQWEALFDTLRRVD